jgi:hypothetical protein|nr:MAG TPA: hypothetical protein [Caudoviricetes sp.]
MSRNSKVKRDKRRKQKKPVNLNEEFLISKSRFQKFNERLFEHVCIDIIAFIPVLVKERINIEEIALERFISLVSELRKNLLYFRIILKEDDVEEICIFLLYLLEEIETDKDLQEFISNKGEEYLEAYLSDLENNKEDIEELDILLTEIVREEFKEE